MFDFGCFIQTKLDENQMDLLDSVFCLVPTSLSLRDSIRLFFSSFFNVSCLAAPSPFSFLVSLFLCLVLAASLHPHHTLQDGGDDYDDAIDDYF